MPDWTISGPGLEPTSAHTLATRLAPALVAAPSPRTWLLVGENQPGLAALAQVALEAGHRIVLPPHTSARRDPDLPSGLGMSIRDYASDPIPMPGTDVRDGWDLALFSSGSTTGRPRAYGFTRDQLATVTGWYETIYQVTGNSTIVTALPAHYNFTFIAGVLLAARRGARLHLADAFHNVLTDAARLAPTADRVIVLANPVVLDQAAPAPCLPANVLIDSGGAPLSTTAISNYRAHGIDLREGYGLTETASLTHFDTEAAATSLGTVGTAMPGIATAITTQGNKPLVEVTSPAAAIPLAFTTPSRTAKLRTGDLGQIDAHGRLRLLGRVDDHPIGGLWPHDTLDALGPLLGRRCALIRHPVPDQVTVRLLTSISPETTGALQDRAADLLGLPRDHVTVTSQGQAPLLHSAKLTRTS